MPQKESSHPIRNIIWASVWSSMQDLTTLGEDDHKKGVGSKLHERSLLMFWKQLGPQPRGTPVVTHSAVMDYNPAAPTRAPAQEGTCRSSEWFREALGGSAVVTWDQNQAFRQTLIMTHRTPLPPSNMEVEPLCFGASQDYFTALDYSGFLVGFLST